MIPKKIKMFSPKWAVKHNAFLRECQDSYGLQAALLQPGPGPARKSQQGDQVERGQDRKRAAQAHGGQKHHRHQRPQHPPSQIQAVEPAPHHGQVVLGEPPEFCSPKPARPARPK